MIATCEVCKKQNPDQPPFQVPWGDHIGPALMRAHLAEHESSNTNHTNQEQQQ